MTTAIGSMDKISTIQEVSRGPILPQTREDTLTIIMEATLIMEVVPIITMTPRMETGMEQAAIRTALTQPHPPRRIKVTLLVSSAGRMDIMPRSVLNQRMGTAMEALGRSPTLSTRDK